jgi:bifunctional pyridoxal-dependent enzyme with beta-cystathionase and maltose regulon repressor activities
LRTKVLLFVSPSNPTGAVYPHDQVTEIGRWAAEHGLTVQAWFVDAETAAEVAALPAVSTVRDRKVCCPSQTVLEAQVTE